MLFNETTKQVVTLAKGKNTHNSPEIPWETLREMHTPSEKTHAKMFQLGERAKFKEV